MNKLLSSILAIVALFVIIVHATDPSSCEYKFADDQVFDLSHVGTLSGTFDGFPVHMNLCQNVPADLCPNGDSSICVSHENFGSSNDLSFAARNADSIPPTLSYNSATNTNTITEVSGKVQCYHPSLFLV